MSLTSAKIAAEKQFGTFLNDLCDNYPELVLKYQINKNMKVDYIEAVLKQMWVQKPYNKIDILDSMTHRGK